MTAISDRAVIQKLNISFTIQRSKYHSKCAVAVNSNPILLSRSVKVRAEISFRILADAAERFQRRNIQYTGNLMLPPVIVTVNCTLLLTDSEPHLAVIRHEHYV
jgi:hypothetical protein